MKTDVLVIGGGPAGLQAATMLARMKKKVLVCDASTPRNAPAKEMHYFPTHDGTSPAEFRRLFRENSSRYPEFSFREERVTTLTKIAGHFEAVLAGGERIQARKLILACGVRDELPSIPGLRELWGDSVFHCPFCHGYEWKDRPIGILGDGDFVIHMIPLLRNLSDDVAVFTNGVANFKIEDWKWLEGNQIPVYEEPLLRLESSEGRLKSLILDNGRAVTRDALLVRPPQKAQSFFAEELGCRQTPEGFYEVGLMMESSVPGLFMAGDLVDPRQTVLTAAWTGMNAGVGAAFQLGQEDLNLRR